MSGVTILPPIDDPAFVVAPLIGPGVARRRRRIARIGGRIGSITPTAANPLAIGRHALRIDHIIAALNPDRSGVAAIGAKSAAEKKSGARAYGRAGPRRAASAAEQGAGCGPDASAHESAANRVRVRDRTGAGPDIGSSCRLTVVVMLTEGRIVLSGMGDGDQGRTGRHFRGAGRQAQQGRTNAKGAQT